MLVAQELMKLGAAYHVVIVLAPSRPPVWMVGGGGAQFIVVEAKMNGELIDPRRKTGERFPIPGLPIGGGDSGLHRDLAIDEQRGRRKLRSGTLVEDKGGNATLRGSTEVDGKQFRRAGNGAHGSVE